MKVLITGSSGVVGRRVVPLLRASGHDVTAVVRSSAGRTRLARQGAAAIDLDLFDPAAVRRAMAGHEVVVNLATHIPRSIRIASTVGTTCEKERGGGDPDIQPPANHEARNGGGY